jgi:hypothetical protein
LKPVAVITVSDSAFAGTRTDASGPAVKFRFTGALPAMLMPMLASAPPTDGGSKTPIISSSR